MPCLLIFVAMGIDLLTARRSQVSLVFETSSSITEPASTEGWPRFGVPIFIRKRNVVYNIDRIFRIVIV
jgi:hypothetical protein